MATKPCNFFLIGLATIAATLAATHCAEMCPNVEHVVNNVINTLNGTWYVQGQYAYPTGKKDQLYCHKAEVDIINDQMFMNSKIPVYCGDQTFDTLLRFVPNPKSGAMDLYRNETTGSQPCYFITLDGKEHMLIYCCNTCKPTVCESFFFFTRDITLDPELIAKMYKKGLDSGLEEKLPKGTFLSANSCFDKNGIPK